MEWHPFTISSAPDRKDILRVNIKKQKNWTKKVYDHFDARWRDHLTEIATDTANNHSRDISLPKDIQFSDEEQDAIIWIEGPFSTCTSSIYDYEHVFLIGAGIGVTPSISALESLIHRLQKQRCICPNCHV